MLMFKHLSQDIYQLFLGMFVELADTKSPYFSKRVALLETIARYNFCVLMLDTGCEDLVLKMFNIFFSVIRYTSFFPLCKEYLCFSYWSLILLSDNVLAYPYCEFTYIGVSVEVLACISHDLSMLIHSLF